MNTFLENLIERSLGTADVLRPRPRSRFERPGAMGERRVEAAVGAELPESPGPGVTFPAPDIQTVSESSTTRIRHRPAGELDLPDPPDASNPSGRPSETDLPESPISVEVRLAPDQPADRDLVQANTPASPASPVRRFAEPDAERPAATGHPGQPDHKRRRVPRVENTEAAAPASARQESAVQSPVRADVTRSIDKDSPESERRPRPELEPSDRTEVGAAIGGLQRIQSFDPESLPQSTLTPADSTRLPDKVTVKIGRVEVRTITPPAPPSPPRSKPNKPAMSLGDYLKGRNGGRS